MVDDKSIMDRAKEIPLIKYLSKGSFCEEINLAINNMI